MQSAVELPKENFENLSAKEFILIKGAKLHNLKNIDVAIPRNKLVVVTGVSGSGKSSLVFDTLFAEGQRMYVESLSAYARQFLARMQKPEVEYIKGVSPAIAIEQRVSSKNPRSTVGTTTEIYDYLKLLYARIGKTFSPISGKEVRKDTVDSVTEYIFSFPEGQKIIIASPLKNLSDRTLETELQILLQKGFTRILINDEVAFIEEFLEQKSENLAQKYWENIFVLIDRTAVKHNDEESRFRIADSVQTAFFEGAGECLVDFVGVEKKFFSDKFELDGITFEEPSIHFFNFNNPYGACKTCEGFGNVLGISEKLVIPNPNLSVYEDAVAPWRTEKMSEWKKEFMRKATLLYDFPIHRAYKDLSEAEKDLLWQGKKAKKEKDTIYGINDFFKFLESESYKIQYRILLYRYRGRTTCPDCKGTRIRKDASFVKINGKSLHELLLMPVEEVAEFFDKLALDEFEQKVAKRILTEIRNRLNYLLKVGLGYLTLNRATATLSGGEFQRIKLATALGSALVGSMYILDEPSIGLHPRDTQELIEVLLQLRNLGNTVVVVEHEEELMQVADYIIDIGPEAGARGGQIIFQGNKNDFDTKKFPLSKTLQYLSGKAEIPVPAFRRKWANSIWVKGARENNLQNIDVQIPLGIFCVITGVSGSGKSTLVKRILMPALSKHFDLTFSDENEVGAYDSLEGDLNLLSGVEYIDQNPIGKSSRSNPVTYCKAYDAIRELFAAQPLAKIRGYKAGAFSFNVEGGRCEVCKGEGEVRIEMQFMADIFVPCEACKGKRFIESILEVTYQGKNITEVLDLTVDEAITFFQKESKIIERLKPLEKVGLGYVKLGQSSDTLSGGEAQRIKLASFLDANLSKKGKKLFIFDEPTTGLHFQDIQKLLTALQLLVENGNSVLVIEHNVEIIKNADWIIDLGPEGGKRGGKICFTGTPEQMVALLSENYTARFLAKKLKK
ncbi:excinuclease ABC subunit UvrA [Raineya orbicola]|uniref:UvrABC system protein A n=1 Tax=Raineya orbicola TaxID=2016530 RepID=A0A2N3II00_9BACT|nr:excinuclease ABC subunit UvrA [Raineya orbicola]PKQ69955.1 uvra: excinuclease ABC subunit A [Raineya orbicola]